MTKQIRTIFGERKLNSRIDFVLLCREGIPMSVFKKIQRYTSLTSKEISEILPVSERQLLRYKDDHILRKDISSTLIQLLELFERGYDIFGEDKFKIWIRSKIASLGNVRPIDILDTPIGIQMVEDTMGRIEHGVYS
jgi:putative toxin-antitoxin system antitoxin component (TIGR02293 family)